MGDVDSLDIFNDTVWNITDVQFVGQGVQDLDYDETDLIDVTFQTSDYTSKGGEESALIEPESEPTLDLSVKFGNTTQELYSVVLIASGHYTRYGDFFITDPSNGNYYMIEVLSNGDLTVTRKVYNSAGLYTGSGYIRNYDIVTTLSEFTR